MKKSELFAHILSIVSDITEISSDVILSSSRSEEVVDARILVVYFCFRKGLYPTQIAALSGFSHKRVNRLITSANARFSNKGYSKGQFSFYSEVVRSRLGLGGAE